MTRSRPLPTAAIAAALAFAAALVMPQIAAAETDLAAAEKVACVPDTVTSCTGPGKCTTREASARDKTQVLVIDFKAKTVSMKTGPQSREVGKITGDKTDGDARKIEMSEGEPGKGGRTASMSLTKAGKLSIKFGASGRSAEATCTAAS